MDVLSVGGEHDGAQAGEVDRVAGMHDPMRLAFDGLEVRGVIMARDVGVFAILTVIEKLADGYTLDEFNHSADVVGVEVSHQQVIDPGDARIAHGGLHAVGIAAICFRASRYRPEEKPPDGATSKVDWPPSTSME